VIPDAEKRVRDLREAGYIGPVDQDGYPRADAVPAEVLDYLRQGILPEQIATEEWDGEGYFRAYPEGKP
jgi:hypothetical protein